VAPWPAIFYVEKPRKGPSPPPPKGGLPLTYGESYGDDSEKGTVPTREDRPHPDGDDEVGTIGDGRGDDTSAEDRPQGNPIDKPDSPEGGRWGRWGR
jgi:hypothetical protein